MLARLSTAPVSSSAIGVRNHKNARSSSTTSKPNSKKIRRGLAGTSIKHWSGSFLDPLQMEQCGTDGIGRMIFHEWRITSSQKSFA